MVAMDMQKNSGQNIDIVKISPSSRDDRSRYYLLDISIIIKKWECVHSEYLDPLTNRIVTHHVRPENDKGIVGNQRAKILSEIGVKLNLSDDDSRATLNELFQSINYLIANSASQNYRAMFPPFEDVLDRALVDGFTLVQCKPEFHFMQTAITPKGDVELHICTPSIKAVLDELEDFESSGYVSNSYSYRSIVQRCAWQSAFYVSVNQDGNGWYLTCRGDEPWERKSGRHRTLRDLYFAVLALRQELAVGP